MSLREGRNLPVWGFPWQSNPFCRLTLGEQTAQSRKDNDTSTTSRHRAPVWNQEMQFLVEDPEKQACRVVCVAVGAGWVGLRWLGGGRGGLCHSVWACFYHQKADGAEQNNNTSTTSRHRAPVWNQEMQFLVEDPEKQVRVHVAVAGTCVVIGLLGRDVGYCSCCMGYCCLMVVIGQPPMLHLCTVTDQLHKATSAQQLQRAA